MVKASVGWTWELATAPWPSGQVQAPQSLTPCDRLGLGGGHQSWRAHPFLIWNINQSASFYWVPSFIVCWAMRPEQRTGLRWSWHSNTLAQVVPWSMLRKAGSGLTVLALVPSTLLRPRGSMNYMDSKFKWRSQIRTGEMFLFPQ